MQLDILAFGAHPDDVELSCGGTLIKLGAAGYKIGIVSLTRAELGTRGSPEIRKKEFGNAAEIIGAYIHEILDISDGNVEINWPNKVKVIQKIRAYRPKIVFAPYWKVRHPDHGHTSQLVSEAAFFSGLKKIETNQLPYRPNKIIYYPCRYEFKPSFIVDISEFHTKKIMAIQAYKSQFFNPEKNKYGDDKTYISSPEFFDSIINRAKQYGTYIGVKYGEPFLIRESMRLDDPLKFFGSE